MNVVLVLLVVVWPLLVFVFLPLLFLLVGVVAAVAVLAARLVSILAWNVEARSAHTVLAWCVRGTFSAGRAVRQLASAIERGEEPRVGGLPPDTVESSRV